jgi:hypothetical protein
MDWGTGQSGKSKVEMLMKNGLYANIHAKRERIKAGSGEKMAKKGAEGRPSAQDFKDAAKTAKPTRREMIESKMKDM